MLLSVADENDSVRFASPDSLEKYMSATTKVQPMDVSRRAALEESFFLGLRLDRGVSLRELSIKFGNEAVKYGRAEVAELVRDGLMEQREGFVSLTPRGRLLSNEVFERFIFADEVAH
jgi:oxygen-independent coproporphyrinogen-3 oxidase